MDTGVVLSFQDKLVPDYGLMLLLRKECTAFFPCKNTFLSDCRFLLFLSGKKEAVKREIQRQADCFIASQFGLRA